MNKKYIQAALFLIFGLGIGQVYTYIVPQDLKKQAVINLEQNKVETQKNLKTKNNIKPVLEEQIQVSIFGAVKKTGKYKIKKGSKLSDLISLAGGFDKGADERIKNYYLKNGSEFTIKYRVKIQVEIIGQINNPGIYRMYEGDKLSSLVAKAGGITSFGIMPEKDYYLKDGKKFFIMKRRMEGESQ